MVTKPRKIVTKLNKKLKQKLIKNFFAKSIDLTLLNTNFWTKSLLIRTTWHLNNQWDVIGTAFCSLAIFPNGFAHSPSSFVWPAFDNYLKNPILYRIKFLKVIGFFLASFIFLRSFVNQTRNKLVINGYQRLSMVEQTSFS